MVAHRHVRQERRCPLHPRDRLAGIPRQHDLPPTSTPHYCTQQRRQDQDARAHPIMGHRCRGSHQPKLHQRSLHQPAARRLPISAKGEHSQQYARQQCGKRSHGSSRPVLKLTAYRIAPRMDRFGRLHALPYALHLHQQKTPLPELRERLLWRMLE